MGWATCAHRRFDFFIGFSLHEATYPPLPTIPYYPHVSFSIVSGLTQLFGLPTDTSDRDIVSDGVHMMGRLSDAFPIVPHLAYPPHPALIVTTLFGSSNLIWGASGVQLRVNNVFSGGEEADCASALGFIVSPDFSCNDPVGFLLDLAFATSSTTQVEMTWGDFLQCLIDVAIQFAMEAGMKVLMKGVSSGWARVKIWKKGAKYTKLGDAMDAVQLGKQMDELADNGWVLNEAAEKAVKEATEAGQEAQESLVYKYGTRYTQRAKKAKLEAVTASASKLDALSKYSDGIIDEKAFKEALQSSDVARFTALKTFDDAVNKLNKVDDNWWQRFCKEWTEDSADSFISRVDDAGTWKSWYKFEKYSDNWYDPRNLISLYKATKKYGMAVTKTSDSWLVSNVGYNMARRCEKVFGKLVKIYWQKGREFASEDKWGYGPWGFFDQDTSRQDLIDALNEQYEGWEESSFFTDADGSRFEWTSPSDGAQDGAESIGVANASRFDWTATVDPDSSDHLWADRDFDRDTVDADSGAAVGMFGWTSYLEEDEEPTESSETG